MVLNLDRHRLLLDDVTVICQYDGKSSINSPAACSEGKIVLIAVHGVSIIHPQWSIRARH